MRDNTGLEDVVVDLVVEVDSRGVDLDEVARSLVVPGVVLLRSASREVLWLTTVVAARDEEEAVRAVRARVLAQVGTDPGAAVATTATAITLGDLFACLDHTDPQRDLEVDLPQGRVDLLDLVAAHVWDRCTLPRNRQRVVALAGTA